MIFTHPIIIGWFLDFLIGVFFLIMGYDVYGDISSTKDAIGKGVAYEANPLMAWLQKKSPKYWWLYKALVTFSLMTGAVVFFPAKAALMVLVLLSVVYFIAVKWNYGLTQ